MCSHTHTHTQSHTHIQNSIMSLLLPEGNTAWKPHYSGKSPFPCHFTQQHLHCTTHTHTHTVWLHLHEEPRDQIFYLTLCGADLTPSWLFQPEESERNVIFIQALKKSVPHRANVSVWQWSVWSCELFFCEFCIHQLTADSNLFIKDIFLENRILFKYSNMDVICLLNNIRVALTSGLLTHTYYKC